MAMLKMSMTHLRLDISDIRSIYDIDNSVKMTSIITQTHVDVSSGRTYPYAKKCKVLFYGMLRKFYVAVFFVENWVMFSS